MAVWVRVPMPQVVQEAYQIYLPAEYLAEEEVVLKAVACQMDSRFHQVEEEVQRVLGFRKTDLCQLDLVVRAGEAE